MPKLRVVTRLMRRSSRFALGASLAAFAAVAALPSTALASHSQVAIIQDGADLVNPDATLQQFRALGANTVRVVIPWAEIAPSPNATKAPKGFQATNPNSYPANAWAPFDGIVEAAAHYNMTVYFTITGGAPRWAEASKPPKFPPGSGESTLFLAWEPNAAAYGQFVQAVGTRYDGHFTPPGDTAPLAAVHFWSLFNEPNFGEDLGPQASNDSSVPTAAKDYRGLINAGWKGLRSSGHAKNTILIGELAAQGQEPGPFPKSSGGLPGDFGQTRPLLFIRELYCVDSSYHQLRGGAAMADGCPTTAGASRAFRNQNPALFDASGFADHPYPQGYSPTSNGGNKVDYATFPDLGKLQTTLDRVNSAYGSHKRFPIYNTEYGYITDPPKGRPYPSPATAATWINQAEYLSWKSSSIASYMQYLLTDPPPNTGIYAGFASGLETAVGTPKATFYAYRLPVWMPHTSFSKSASEEVWGDARPAPSMSADGDGAQSVAIQLNGKTIDTVPLKGSTGYFDVHVKFPSSGSVRLAYTYPSSDPFLPMGDLGTTAYSRSFNVSVH